MTGSSPRKTLAAAITQVRARLWESPSFGEGTTADHRKKLAYTICFRILVQHIAARLPGRTGVLARVRIPETPAVYRANCRALAPALPGLFGHQRETTREKIHGRPAEPTLPERDLGAVLDVCSIDELVPCWHDDLTLGWAFSRWYEPERRRLDAAVCARTKLAPEHLAHKTQVFSEPYLIQWTLQNSLLPIWLAICARNGWVPEVEQRGVLEALEAQRVLFRQARAAGEVCLKALLPLGSPTQRKWAYWMPGVQPEDHQTFVPPSIADLRIFDPCVGAGHFLLVAADHLVDLYEEEARQRNVPPDDPNWSRDTIVRRIFAHNLHGFDIDPQVVALAAVALWLKAQKLAPGVELDALSLAAPPPSWKHLDNRLASIYHRGSLDRPAFELSVHTSSDVRQMLVDASPPDDLGVHLGSGHASVGLRIASMLAVGGFPGQADARTVDPPEGLTAKTDAADEQHRATGETSKNMSHGLYDLVVGNPPYLGAAKIRGSAFLRRDYPLAKADFYAACMQRGLELTRPGGTCALLTPRSWMYTHQYRDLRRWLLETNDLRRLGDFDRGAFEDRADERVSVVVSVFHRRPPRRLASLALRPTPPDDRTRDGERTQRKRAATLAGIGRYEFFAHTFSTIPGTPLLYDWTPDEFALYETCPTVGDSCPARFGLTTGDNRRFVRAAHERPHCIPNPETARHARWVPYVLGAKGLRWFEPLRWWLDWDHGLQLQLFRRTRRGVALRNPGVYFRQGIAFAMIGHTFSARLHLYPSIIGNMGSSVFPRNPVPVLMAMNRSSANRLLCALNSGLHFEVGDVNRLPLQAVEGDTKIFSLLLQVFSEHLRHREPFVEYQSPGPSQWRAAQAWAMRAVDRPSGTDLPTYVPVEDAAKPLDELSHALGVTLGRFVPTGGIASHTPAGAIPHGVLWIDQTLRPGDSRDSLGHPAARPLVEAWSRHQSKFPRGLRDLLTRSGPQGLFADHLARYRKRPIYWPLASAKRTFVAWINYHRFAEHPLAYLLETIVPTTMTRLRGVVRDSVREELEQFATSLRQCAQCGPHGREVDAVYHPHVDDGVLVNAAGLWPLLRPFWSIPRQWWQHLVSPSKRHDLDWSHLAGRYFPTRVEQKCRDEPSLAYRHGCLWRLHPQLAWSSEMYMQRKSHHGPTYAIEPGDFHRAQFIEYQQPAALEAIALELRQRNESETVIGLHGVREPWTAMYRAFSQRVRARFGDRVRVLLSQTATKSQALT